MSAKTPKARPARCGVLLASVSGTRGGHPRAHISAHVCALSRRPHVAPWETGVAGPREGKLPGSPHPQDELELLSRREPSSLEQLH